MKWSNKYLMNNMPTPVQISEYINNPLWEELNDYLQNSYNVSPKYSYSRCSMQAGWNIKYQKAGKSLCTLYPMENYYIALVVIGIKEKPVVKELLTTFTPYVQELINRASSPTDALWLMINVTDDNILSDVKTLIRLRRKP